MLKKFLQETGVKFVVSVTPHEEVSFAIYSDNNEFIADITEQDLYKYIIELTKKEGE